MVTAFPKSRAAARAVALVGSNIVVAGSATASESRSRDRVAFLARYVGGDGHYWSAAAGFVSP